jgi:hypothetical protein
MLKDGWTTLSQADFNKIADRVADATATASAGAVLYLRNKFQGTK